MKFLRKTGIFLLAALLLATPVFALTLDAGTGDDFYVQDTANVLSTATQDQIVSYNKVMETSCDEAQLVVVTVSYLEEDTEVASLQLMNDWGVGSASESNGMLLLLVANEKRGWLSTGDGIDGAFTADMADEYLNDYFWDYIDNDKFDEGVLSLTSELYNWYLDYYNVNETQIGGGIEQAPSAVTNNNQGGSTMGSLILIIVIIAIIVGLGRVGSRRRWWHRRPPMGGGPRPPMGGGPRPPMGGGPRPPMGGGPRPPVGGGPRPPMGGGPRGGGGGGHMGGGPRGGGGGGHMGGGSHGGGFGGHGGGGGGGRH